MIDETFIARRKAQLDTERFMKIFVDELNDCVVYPEQDIDGPSTWKYDFLSGVIDD